MRVRVGLDQALMEGGRGGGPLLLERETDMMEGGTGRGVRGEGEGAGDRGRGHDRRGEGRGGTKGGQLMLMGKESSGLTLAYCSCSRAASLLKPSATALEDSHMKPASMPSVR